MANNVDLYTFASLANDTSATTNLNSNSAIVTTALANTLALDGTAPNSMQANLDMNNFNINNLPLPVNQTNPLRLMDVSLLNGGGTITAYPLPVGGTTGEVLAKNSSANYDVTWVSPEVISVSGSSSLSLTGGTLSTQALTGDVTTPANSFSTTISSNAVTGSKFRASAGLSLVGNPNNGSGNVVDISGISNQIPMVNSTGNTLAFTSVVGDISNSNGTFTVQPSAITSNKIATNTVANTNLAQAAALTFKGNPTTSTANESDFTIDGLTLKASPASSDEIIVYDVSGTALKKTTVGAIGAVGSVASIAGNTGAFTLGAGITNSTNVLLTDTTYYSGEYHGLTLSNDSVTPNTVFDIALGSAVSDDNTTFMKLAAFTKTTGSWTLGSGNGALDTGSVAASTWYYVYLIERTDTGVVDILISINSSSPTLPSSYTKKVLIGFLLTDGSAHIRAFTQIGRQFYWVAPIVQSSITGSATFTTQTIAFGVPARATKVSGLWGSTATHGSNMAVASNTSGLGVQVGAQPAAAASTVGGALISGSYVTFVEIPITVSQQIALFDQNANTLDLLYITSFVF
jgi:hypothetical protein